MLLFFFLNQHCQIHGSMKIRNADHFLDFLPRVVINNFFNFGDEVVIEAQHPRSSPAVCCFSVL